MPLTDTFTPDSSCSGLIVGFGELAEVVDRIEEFLRAALPQILPSLSPLRKNTTKPRNEKDLCAELGKRLNFAAHDELFCFYPEDPENESASRTLDYGAYPQVHFYVGSRLLGATDRLYGLEAKRLPTCTSPIEQREREREYVVGNWHLRSSARKPISGGIERFKEGLHGTDLERVGMVAFIQKHDPLFWLTEINRWIADLIDSPLDSHHALWADSDKLRQTTSEKIGFSELCSVHERGRSPALRITHFWLLLG